MIDGAKLKISSNQKYKIILSNSNNYLNCLETLTLFIKRIIIIFLFHPIVGALN